MGQVGPGWGLGVVVEVWADTFIGVVELVRGCGVDCVEVVVGGYMDCVGIVEVGGPGGKVGGGGTVG